MTQPVPEVEMPIENETIEEDSLRRLTVTAAVEQLGQRDQELVALRFGADLTAAQIARILEMRTNAVEVALHRALERLRSLIEPESRQNAGARHPADSSPREAPGRP